MIRDANVDDALELSDMLTSLAMGYLVEDPHMLPDWYAAAFGTLVSANGLKWLPGQAHLQHFQAANGTVRTFCNHCGSSLGFLNARGGDIELAIATFYDPLPVHVSAHIYTDYCANWYVIIVV